MDGVSPKNLVSQYNDWLKSVHLRQLIKATDFSFKKQISQTGSIGTTSFENVAVLTLEADSNFTSRSKFASEWSALNNRKNPKDKIYKILYTKLADYADIDREKMIIKFTYKKSELFSFLIYFNNGIKVNKALIEVRGSSGSADPGDLDDNSVGGILNNMPESPNLNQNIVKGLTAFFKKHKHESPIIVEAKAWGAGNMHFKVSHILGEVTGNLNEMVLVNVFIQPAEKGHVDISFLFTVLYAGGIFSRPADIDEYKDAVVTHKKNVSAYGIRLKQQMRVIANVK